MMTPWGIKAYSNISVHMIPTSDWAGDIFVVPSINADGVGPVSPGRQVGDVLLVETAQGQHQLRLSLGSESTLDVEMVRRAGGAAAKWLSAHDISSAAVRAADLV
ncbi:MAG: hypothetical protein PVF74_13165, partial [Anaerolineales bacterium]